MQQNYGNMVRTLIFWPWNLKETGKWIGQKQQHCQMLSSHQRFFCIGSTLLWWGKFLLQHSGWNPVLTLQMQEGDIWFIEMVVETPLGTVWREYLELLVVLIAECQGATWRTRCHITFRWMCVSCCRGIKSTLLNTLFLLGSTTGCASMGKHMSQIWKSQAPCCLCFTLLTLVNMKWD